MERFFKFKVWRKDSLSNKHIRKRMFIDLLAIAVESAQSTEVDGNKATKVQLSNGLSYRVAMEYNDFFNAYKDKLIALENENPPSNSAN